VGERGGKRPVGRTEPLVGFDQKAGADRWARTGRERGEREKFLIKILKVEIELKKRVFLEKAFQHPIKSRKISWISTKITLIDFDLLNHSNSDIMSKRRFIHKCLMNFSFKKKNL
jgi:hypothetical protein